MKKLLVSSVILINTFGFAKPTTTAPQEKIYSREEIQSEVVDAQAEFERAKEMFNPWYAGPLLTPSPNVLGKGLVNIQPYMFFTGNTRQYSKSGSSESIPTLFQVNPQFITQIGVWDRFSIINNVPAIYNRQNGQSSFNIQDISLNLAFQALKSSPHTPAISLTVSQVFPAGKYENLNPAKGGVDATGSGAYKTSFSFTMGRVIWWIPNHPMNVRMSLNYQVSTDVGVKSFNAYGGGYGTNGKVNVGNSLTADAAFEYSFVQKWALACDFVYTYSSKSTFTGNSGLTAAGAVASVGGPFSDQLSMAPAIEYNPTANVGFLVGVWYPLWGRNSLGFVSGVITAEYTF